MAKKPLPDPMARYTISNGAEDSLYKPSKADAKREENRREVITEDPFLAFIKNTSAKHPVQKTSFKFTDEQADWMKFLDYDLEPKQVWATAQYLGSTIAFFLTLAFFILAFTDILGNITFSFFNLATLSLFGLGGQYIAAAILSIIAYVAMPSIIAAIMLMLFKTKVENEKLNALAHAPEIVNYLIMSLRITPNMEKAVEFAASHGQGKIAEDFKKIVWNVQLGKYYTVEEGIDELAYKWGPYNEDFKQALIMIRGSILEPDLARRVELLEKAVADLLEGSQEKMEGYAMALHQPTVLLYYFGILLPLMLAIILPIAGSLANANIGIGTIALGYNLILPALIYVFGIGIIGKRPPTYTAPKIPDDFPGLPPKGQGRIPFIKTLIPYAQVAIVIFLAFVAGGFIADNAAYENDKATSFGLKAIGEPVHFMLTSKGVEFRALTENESPTSVTTFFTLPPKNTFLLFGTLIGFALGLSIYLRGKYDEKLKAQNEIREMEGEFKDAIYVLASRLAENRPMEDAMRHAISFLPKSTITNRIFKKVLENISTMGMTIEVAIFDPVFGAMKNMPSNTLRGGMQTLINAGELGASVAARSLIGLALQLRNAQKIDTNLRKLLADVTSLLGTMATFVAPVVLAVVGSMQGLITSSIASANANNPDTSNLQQSGVSTQQFQAIGGLGGNGSKSNQIDPQLFTIVLAIYLLEVVILLVYFNSQVEEPGNNIYSAVKIANALPIAVIIYSVVSIVASAFLSGASANIG